MLKQELNDKIKIYLKPDYFELQNHFYELWEREQSGLSRLNVELQLDDPYNVLCIAENDKKPKCGFLNETANYSLQKSVDHVLLAQKENGSWLAFLIEMKSTVDNKRWEEIKGKVRASMLNVLAVAAVLGITVDDFCVCTTYEQVKLINPSPVDLAARKAYLGKNWKRDEWDKGVVKIRIPIGKEAPIKHFHLQMTRQDVSGQSTLCGELILNNTMEMA